MENARKLGNEESVKDFYEQTPYPDLGAAPKNPLHWVEPALVFFGADKDKDRLVVLDAGCGTGHEAVGVAKRFPGWKLSAIDLSGPSVEVARKLAEMHGVSINFMVGSYLDPIPFDTQFDLIYSMGSIHHCEFPSKAIKNLLGRLKEGGVFVMHLYGKNLDRDKFLIREVLDIIEPNIGNVEFRFKLYQDLMEKRKKGLVELVLDLSPRVMLRSIRDWIRKSRRKSRGESWSPPWNEKYTEPTAPWIDHFCHPLERSYDVRDVEKLANESNLKVVKMLSQGREQLNSLPANWQAYYDKLDEWSQRRLMELLDITDRSVLLIGMHQNHQ